MQVTRVLVESYFDLVRKSLQDSVPKVRSRINSGGMSILGPAWSGNHLIRLAESSVHPLP